MVKTYREDQIVKTCRKLESGLRFGQEGLHACQLGPFSAPLYWTGDQMAGIKITKEMIVQKRRELFDMLNSDESDVVCKKCHMVKEKKYKEVDFTKLGHVDMAATSTCNIRCDYCAYTKNNSFAKAKYDSHLIFEEFHKEDVEWDSAVDFGGGEPTILRDFDKYIDYFVNNGIRIYLYTNAVKFRQSVYDGLKNGDINWVCVSLDCGTPTTYKRTKLRDYYNRVMENLSRYAHAGNFGKGRLSVKYIFTSQNSTEDDITGFSYSMLAIRPQKVWLTFDFDPVIGLSPNAKDLGGYDYSPHVYAYAKTYLLLKKHGIEAGHFTEHHLAAISKHGKILMERAHQMISKLKENEYINENELKLKDFRTKHNIDGITDGLLNDNYFTIKPLHIFDQNNKLVNYDFESKKVLLAPACYHSVQILDETNLQKAKIIGFVDRDPVMQKKLIKNYKVYDYSEINTLQPDIVLLASPEQHFDKIRDTLRKNLNNKTNIAIYLGDNRQRHFG